MNQESWFMKSRNQESRNQESWSWSWVKITKVKTTKGYGAFRASYFIHCLLEWIFSSNDWMHEFMHLHRIVVHSVWLFTWLRGTFPRALWCRCNGFCTCRCRISTSCRNFGSWLVPCHGFCRDFGLAFGLWHVCASVCCRCGIGCCPSGSRFCNQCNPRALFVLLCVHSCVWSHPLFSSSFSCQRLLPLAHWCRARRFWFGWTPPRDLVPTARLVEMSRHQTVAVSSMQLHLEI